MTPVVVLDIETYYKKPDYSLSSKGKHATTTEQYLRDERFLLHGLGIKVDDSLAHWYPRHEVLRHLGFFQDLCRRSICVGHNSKFDFAALAWHYGFKFGLMADTLSMARPIIGSDAPLSLASLSERFQLGAKGRDLIDFDGVRDLTPEQDRVLGEYCCNDVELTAKLFDRLRVGFPKQEMKVIDRTLRMFVEPVLVGDQALLEELHTETVNNKQALFEALNTDAKALGSNDLLAALLRSHGVDPPTKWSIKQKKQVYAFAKSDEEFIALKDYPNETVGLLIEARLGVKSTLDETRAKRLLDISRRGLIPVPKKYCGASTWRWSGDDSINLENLPRGGKLRKALQAPPGWVIVKADSRQIEARVLAWMAGQHDLNQAFAADADVYSMMAAKIYGRLVDRMNNPEDAIPGHVGKSVVLGAGYNLGWKKFQHMIRIGMFGAEGVLFDESFVDTLEVDVATFLADPWNQAGVTLTYRPWDDLKVHQVHCAVSKRIIDDYRASVPMIVNFWRQMGFAITAMAEGTRQAFGTCDVVTTTREGMYTPGGLKLLYPDLKQHEEQVIDPETGETETRKQWTYAGRGGERKRTYGGHLTENVDQHLSRLIISDQMVDVSMRYKVISTTHDEIITLVPASEADEGLQWTLEQMRVVPKWAPGLILNAAGSYNTCYS